MRSVAELRVDPEIATEHSAGDGKKWKAACVKVTLSRKPGAYWRDGLEN